MGMRYMSSGTAKTVPVIFLRKSYESFCRGTVFVKLLGAGKDKGGGQVARLKTQAYLPVLPF
jgi:hypothetical protein